MLYKPFKALNTKHMWNHNTNNKSKEMRGISLPECPIMLLSRWKPGSEFKEHTDIKSSFLWTWVHVNVCVGGRLRGGLAIAVVQVAAAFVAGAVGASARAPFLFFFFLVRSVKAEASVTGGWAWGGDREALIRISMWKERPEMIISEGMLGYQNSECRVTIFNRPYNSVSSLVTH